MKNSKLKEKIENALEVINDKIFSALAKKTMKGDFAAIRLYDKRVKDMKIDRMKKELFGL